MIILQKNNNVIMIVPASITNSHELEVEIPRIPPLSIYFHKSTLDGSSWNSSWFWSPHTTVYHESQIKYGHVVHMHLVTCIQVWSCPVAELVQNSEISPRTPIPIRIHSCSFIFTSVFQNHSNKTSHLYNMKSWFHDPPLPLTIQKNIKGKRSWYLKLTSGTSSLSLPVIPYVNEHSRHSL